jgi:nucleotidyltransferase substrate binding protein (TIGR01987 family)
MEIINIRYDALKKALLTLDEAIEMIESIDINQGKSYILMRDGLIQRFEYCIDSFWKFLKLYLEEVQKISPESSSPRAILRDSLAFKVINQEQYDIFIDCLVDRNLTSHSYNEDIVEKIQEHIPRYYQTMKAIADKLYVD